MLSERRFEEELNVIKANHAFRGITKDCKFELVEKKDLIEQLEASKSSIGDLLSNFLNETKVFKYQITIKVTSQKKLNLLQFI